MLNPQPRPLYIPPARVPYRLIKIYHPGYDPKILILKLFASPIHPDGDLADFSNYALPFDLVLEACMILANNKSGVLRSRASNSDLPQRTTMVEPGDYTFRIKDVPSDSKYPICRNFFHWTPPKDVPSSWLFDGRDCDDNDLPLTKPSSASGAVRAADKECIMSFEDDRIDFSHLIPVLAKKWFIQYEMCARAGDEANPTVNSPNNLLMLRHDLGGHGLDIGDFCFFPYKGAWATIWIGIGSRRLASEFNYRRINLPLRLRASYLHARFAWNVFLLATRYCLNESLRFVEIDIDLRDSNCESSNNNEGGRGRGRGGGSGGGGGRTSRGDEDERPQPKKRHHDAQLAEPDTKKRRKNPDDIPDISRIGPSQIARLKAFDRRLSTDPVFRQTSGRYPGFSRAVEMQYQYRCANPAATDPGGARIALVSER
ncbi:hypothetical protein B0H12DRAFT_1091800 [Mycena haematopus]|nr:hypothetical protein B0H12DRAFT_1091800 [Mycena haematopus]